MADDPTTSDDQASDDVASTAATDAAHVTDTGTDSTDQASTDQEPFDAERARALIRKLREEAKGATRAIKERDALQARIKAHDDAQLSEQERLTKRAADLERELETERTASRDLSNRHEVERLAATLGAIDPEVTMRLIDWSQVDYDEAGKPTNVKELVSDLLADKPYLKAPEQTNQRQPAGSVGNPATRTVAPGSRRYTAADISNRAFYLANKADIDLAMRQGRVDA